MTTYQMQAFITLAQTLNYTRASALLHTTQPNLSKIVVNLEQETGAQLLARNKRDVKLTPAGKIFYNEIKQVMERYESALRATREAYEGVTGVVSVGFLGTAMTHLLPDIVSRFRERYPKIRLDLADYTYSPLIEALLSDKVDIAMLPDRNLESIRGLEHKFLYSDDMCLVADKNHRLAGAQAVDLAELAAEPFVMMDPMQSSWDVELVNNICANEDFTPQVVYQANTLNNLVLMIECGVGVSILAKHMRQFATENTRFVNIRGYESYFRMVCTWRRGADSNVRKLVEVISAYLGEK